MSISLQKGQKVSLSKENAGLKRIVVGLGWDEAPKGGGGFLSSLFGSGQSQEGNIDCDASAFLLQGGRIVNKGDGDDEQITIDLENIPAVYDRIVIVVNIYQAVQRRQEFGMIRNAFIRLVDASTNKEILKYNLTENYSGMTAMIFGEVYRHNGEWKFSAVGQGTTDPGLGELASRYM